MNARTLSLSLAAAAACSLGVARAGDLTPPGAPAPTMKTLAEVEARTPVGPLTTPGDPLAVYVLRQPGSYYLTENLVGESGKAGIRIESPGVTLDLNGFTLVGDAGVIPPDPVTTTHGVTMLTWYDCVTVRNGVIRNWGGSGVHFKSDGGVLEDLSIAGCGEWGLNLNDAYSNRVRNCSIYACGSVIDLKGGGIYGSAASTIDNCAVRSVVGMGIHASLSTVRDCIVWNTTADPSASQSGAGILAMLVESSHARYSGGVGISGQMLVRGCVSMNNTGADYSGPNIVDSY